MNDKTDSMTNDEIDSLLEDSDDSTDDEKWLFYDEE